MRAFFLILISLFYCGSVFADHNLAMLYNNEDTLDLSVNYSTCYTYNNLYLYTKEYCTPGHVILYGKNNPKGDAFAAIDWLRYPGSTAEYLKIESITATNPAKNGKLYFNLVNPKVYTWDNGDPYHETHIFSIKHDALYWIAGVF